MCVGCVCFLHAFSGAWKCSLKNAFNSVGKAQVNTESSEVGRQLVKNYMVLAT